MILRRLINKKMIELFNSKRTVEITITFTKREVIEGYMMGYISGYVVKYFDAYSPWKKLIVTIGKTDGKPSRIRMNVVR